jgi:hypothetical protein
MNEEIKRLHRLKNDLELAGSWEMASFVARLINDLRKVIK